MMPSKPSSMFGRHKLRDQLSPEAVKHQRDRQREARQIVAERAETCPDSIFAALLKVGHDEDYRPRNPAQPTQAQPGSADKLRILADRVQAGQPLWHEDDRDCWKQESDEDDEVKRAARALLHELARNARDGCELE